MKNLKWITVMQSVLIVGLVFIISGLLVMRKNSPETVPASLEMNTSEKSVQQPATEILESEIIYETTGEKIFLQDAEFGEIWIPVLADVPPCEYHSEQFVKRNHLTYYVENQKIVSSFGIDVSSHQKEIDWKTVKKAGVDFAMIRVGYRGYSGGKLMLDDYFQQNIQGAIDAGIDVGLYFYSQAITPEEAVEEAELLLSAIGDFPITYPIAYDWELVTTDVARTDYVPVKTLTECSIAFCERIKQAGYLPMIYQNKRTSLLKLDLPELTEYDFWLAEYNEPATYYYNYQMWQYASDGSVPGVQGDVDVNICFKNYHSDTKEPEETENKESKESDENA